MTAWYESWFNEDYLALYSHRSTEEATEQVARLIHLLNLRGHERILDLACGAGRHVHAFATLGFDVVGVDLSPVLLQRARLQANTATVYQRDMRQLTGLGKFDLVTNFFTSFGYFDSREEDLEVLKAARGVLWEGGHFFLDYLHPCTPRAREGEVVEEKIGNTTVISRYYLEDCFACKEVQFPNKTYEEKVHLYEREELEEMCTHADLQIIAWYDDYTGRPWREDGERQLLVARA